LWIQPVVERQLFERGSIFHIKKFFRARVLSLRPHASAVGTGFLAALGRGDVFNKMEQKSGGCIPIEIHKRIC